MVNKESGLRWEMPKLCRSNIVIASSSSFKPLGLTNTQFPRLFISSLLQWVGCLQIQ